MKYLDMQLLEYKEYLMNDVGIPIGDIDKIGTEISSEIVLLPDLKVENIINQSPIELKHRYNELIAFQRMMDFIKNNKIIDSGVIRSQVITQNYICFVYLKDSYFELLENETEQKSITHRCCNFLTSSKIQKFRNSVAHGNWCYKADFSGLEYWDYLNRRER